MILNNNYNKKIFVKARFFLPKNKIEHIFVYGQTGSGKTLHTTVIACQSFSYRKHKIWDIWDLQRGENMCYLFPSQFKNWINGIEGKNGKMYYGKTYPCTLLYPMNKTLVRKEVPPQTKLFTIPITSLDLEDIQALVGGEISKSERDLWDSIKETYIKPETTAPELLKIISELPGKKIKSNEGYDIPPISKQVSKSLFGAIKKLSKQHIITSEKCQTCINLKQEYKERTISSLVTKDCDKWLALWIAHWMIRNIFKMLVKTKHIVPSAIFCRELKNLIPKKTENPAQETIKNRISEVLTDGIRSANLYLIGDTQYPTQLDTSRGQGGITIVHQIKYYDDIVDLMVEESKGYVDNDVRTQMPTLMEGWCYVFSKRGRWHGYARPPRCLSVQPKHDVFKKWEQEGGGFNENGVPIPGVTKNIQDKIELIKQDYSLGIKRNIAKNEIRNIKKKKMELKKQRIGVKVRVPEEKTKEIQIIEKPIEPMKKEKVETNKEISKLINL